MVRRWVASLVPLIRELMMIAAPCFTDTTMTLWMTLFSCRYEWRCFHAAMNDAVFLQLEWRCFPAASCEWRCFSTASCEWRCFPTVSHESRCFPAAMNHAVFLQLRMTLFSCSLNDVVFLQLWMTLFSCSYEWRYFPAASYESRCFFCSYESRWGERSHAVCIRYTHVKVHAVHVRVREIMETPKWPSKH